MSNLNKLIKQLTEQDPKTLSQKALKVCEESGELAKVVLPFDNAGGTIHRFVDKNAILEEVADVYLSAISIAYDLGFDELDFDEMVTHKAKKWAEIQSRENKIDDKVPYEIHVTVSTNRIKFFQNECKKIGVKPIVLALQTEDGEFQDVMTSSVHVGNNRSAYQEMKRISFNLLTNFKVVREKIETVPWHPAAPSNEQENPVMPKDCYFESHVGVILENEDDYEELKTIASTCSSHLSRNVFKKHDDGTSTIMITYRSKSTRENFQENLDWLVLELERAEFKTEKVITEFSIYDTKESHDAAWLNK